MSNLKFYGLSALPQELEANAFYFITKGTHVESFVTDVIGQAKMVGNAPLIKSIVMEELASWGDSSQQIEIVQDIAARDAFSAESESNILAIVLDSSENGDGSGSAALYAYEHSAKVWHKLSDYGDAGNGGASWETLSGKPVSNPVDIDSAVNMKHLHSNKTVLDLLGEDSNENLTFRGAKVTTQWVNKDW